MLVQISAGAVDYGLFTVVEASTALGLVVRLVAFGVQLLEPLPGFYMQLGIWIRLQQLLHRWLVFTKRHCTIISTFGVPL